MASPPFAIAETVPADTDLISQYPIAEHTFRDIVESWLTILSDPATGLLKPTALTFPFVITNASGGTFLTMESTDVGAAAGPNIETYRNSASPAASDLIGGYYFYGKDSAGNKQEYGLFYATIDDATSGSEDSTIRIRNQVAGVTTDRISLTATGVTLTGTTSVTALTASSTITSGSDITALQNFQSSTVNVVLAPTGVGVVILRPNGAGSSSGQLSVNSAGTVTINGAVNATGTITSSAGNVVATAGGFSAGSNVFSTVSANTMIFRPNGLGSATAQMTYTAAGNLTAAGDITASSDRRLKKSISPLGLEWAQMMVADVQPMTFLRKRSDQRGIGFIAQDVQAYAPELIHTDTRGYLSLAYPNMVAILWKVVQDQQARLAALEAK